MVRGWIRKFSRVYDHQWAFSQKARSSGRHRQYTALWWGHQVYLAGKMRRWFAGCLRGAQADYVGAAGCSHGFFTLSRAASSMGKLCKMYVTASAYAQAGGYPD